MFKEFASGLTMIVVAFIVIAFTSLGIYYFTKPASIAIDNRAFHNGQPYIDGMRRDLENFQMSYLDANNPDKRAAIRAIVLDRFAGFDTSQLPQNLRDFINQLKNGN